MAIEFVGAEAVLPDSATEYEVPALSGVQEGDLLILFTQQDSDSPVNVTADDFTLGVSDSVSNFFDGGFYRWATDNEPDAYTVGGGSNSNCAAMLLAFRGVDPDDPFAVSMAAADTSNTTSQVAPSVTVPSGVDGAALVVAWFEAGPFQDPPTRNFSATPPTGMTYAVRNPNSWVWQASAYQILSGSGATGTRTATLSTAPSGTGTCITMALRPAPEGPSLETQRFYLTNTNAPFKPLAGIDAWDQYEGIFEDAHYLGQTPAGAATTSAVAETTTTSGWDVLLGQWVSDPATSAGTLGGAGNLMIARAESSDAANFVTYFTVWVTAGSATALRGLAWSADGTTEWPTTAAAIGFGVDVAEVEFEAGDRIVVEVGYRANNDQATSYTGTLHYGGTATPDLNTGDSGANLSRPAWIDLSITPGVTFEAPPAVEGTAAAALGGLAASASGVPTTPGTATAALGGLAASASGDRATSGTAAAPLGGLAGTATSVRATTGTAAGSLGGLAATAAGAPVRHGAASAPLGGLDAAAAGTRIAVGAATAPLGGLTADAVSVRATTGAASAPLGGLSATADGVGQAPNEGFANAPLGGLTATASGTRATDATSALAPLGGLAATAAGVVEEPPRGTATAPLGGLTAAADGSRGTFATATAPLAGLAGAATSRRGLHGSATALLGGLTAEAFAATSGEVEPGRFFLAI